MSGGGGVVFCVRLLAGVWIDIIIGTLKGVLTGQDVYDVLFPS